MRSEIIQMIVELATVKDVREIISDTLKQLSIDLETKKEITYDNVTWQLMRRLDLPDRGHTTEISIFGEMTEVLVRSGISKISITIDEITIKYNFNDMCNQLETEYKKYTVLKEAHELYLKHLVPFIKYWSFFGIAIVPTAQVMGLHEACLLTGYDTNTVRNILRNTLDVGDIHPNNCGVLNGVPVSVDYGC